jgi:hypothetical protein
MSLNMFADSAREQGSIARMQQYGFNWSNGRETGYAEHL